MLQSTSGFKFPGGEDEVIATNYINKEIGTCPISIKRIEKGSVLKGYLTKLDEAKNELIVDVGVFEPKIALATVPLAHLQAQLADGKGVDLKKIAEVFGLHENLPLTIKIVDLAGEEETGGCRLNCQRLSWRKCVCGSSLFWIG